MERSSSSSSGLDEASMDDSEQEHEFDYDIDDGEDDGPEYFDDIPDEEEDDDDDDDDLDGHVPHIPPVEISAAIANALPDIISLHTHRFDNHSHSVPFRLPRHLANSVEGDTTFVDLPLNSGSGRDESIRTLFLNPYEGHHGDPANAFISHLDSMRLVDPTNVFSRLRPTPLPLIASRFGRNSEPASAVHPHLHPVRPPTTHGSSSTADLLSSLARRSSHLASILDRSQAPPSPTHSTPMSLARDAMHHVSTLFNSSTSESGQSSSDANLVDSDYVSTSVPRTHAGEPLTHLYNADLMRTVAVAPRAAPALAALTRPRRSSDPRPSRDSERSLEKVPSSLASRWKYEPCVSGGDALPIMFDPDALVRTASHDVRHYFNQSSQSIGGPQQGVDVPRPVVAAASKVTGALEDMLVNLWSISDKLETAERKIEEEKRKREEEQKKAEEKQKSSSIEDDANKTENPSTAAPSGSQENDKPSMVDEPEVPVSGGEPSDRQNPSAASRSEDEDVNVVDCPQADVNDRSEVEEQDAEMETADAPSNEERDLGDHGGIRLSDIIADVSPLPASPAAPGSSSSIIPLVTDGAEDGGAIISRDDGETSPATDSATPASGRFSAIATERAAAAGISLEAPANENPEVVAAATQSTGIDPAFLAALPDDMRTEILTQYYEQIRTNTNAGEAGSSSPPATSVNQDFLIALPPALRAEVLELEAEFQMRQEGRGASGTNQTPTAPNTSEGPNLAAAEMDNATFLATLAPDLREEILLTSGEAFIQSLPPNVAAEARVLRERDMSTRIPWRVHVDPRELPSMRSHGAHGRRAERPVPREIPAYRWKNVNGGWLREKPNVENEPKVPAKADGIAALVSLLWARNGAYMKNLLSYVFLHECKSTSARQTLLDEFFHLISKSVSGDDAMNDISTFDPSATRPPLEGDRASFHGTAVRRALELLTIICKDDIIVAESLLGLPTTAEEVKHAGERSVEESDEESSISKASNSNLSTILSWISSKLFERSVAHLEQLVVLVHAVAHAIPPQRVKGLEKARNRRASGRQRLFERGNLMRNFNETMNMLFVPDDEEGGGMIGMQDDDTEEVVVGDSFDGMYDLASGSAGNRSGGSRGDNTEGSNSDDAKKKDGGDESDGFVPVRYRVPALRNSELEALTKVLLRSGCSEKTYDRVARTIGLLGELPDNRLTFMRVLVSIATDAGNQVQKKYEECLETLGTSSATGRNKSRDKCIERALSLGNAVDEVTLLRVVKSLSTLLHHNSAQIQSRNNESGDDARDKRDHDDLEVEQAKAVAERAFRESTVLGLRDVWSALDRILVCVSDEAKSSTTKDRKNDTSSTGLGQTIASAVAMLESERAKASSGGLSPTLARLSPMIEAFLITHSAEEEKESGGNVKNDAPGSEPSSPMITKSVPNSPMANASDEGVGIDVVASDKTLDERLAVFVERHRVAINALLRANGTLLETSFKGALRHPHAIDFDNKKAYFRNVIKKRSSAAHAGAIRISVRRDRVFDDSYQQLRLRTPNEMKGRLHVSFTGEEGVDAGGVTREWYTILARQIFDPNYVLFTRSAAKAATYQPDKRSYINKEHLENFRFVGRIIGKAIYDGQLLDAYFTRSFYKHILGLRPTFHDIEAEDPEYYKSLKWMLENNINGILDYTMSAEYDEFGKQTIVDLMPNGRNIPVMEENKALYVKLVTEVRMTKTIEKQIEAFKEGFYELIPYEDCKIFNEVELELLMSGLPDIDVSDLKANVEYTGYTASSPQVNWFWGCVSKMGQEDLARLVMFVTGTSKVPLEGFGHLQGMNGVQKFQIHRVGGATMRLPSAHTCFNQLDLPEYSTAEILSERLLKAIRECNEGFGFA